MIIYIIILHASNFVYAFSKDCSIRVVCVQFTSSVCFIRVISTALLEYINLLKIV